MRVPARRRAQQSCRRAWTLRRALAHARLAPPLQQAAISTQADPVPCLFVMRMGRLTYWTAHASAGVGAPAFFAHALADTSCAKQQRTPLRAAALPGQARTA